ncbi:hypothetical protein L4D00_11670 [Photobacterium swingsii]|uniref:hypothetical protein n=1 Tax=Photobacterium swingsii TaxID=680026 RepID=UPI003D0AA629
MKLLIILLAFMSFSATAANWVVWGGGTLTKNHPRPPEEPLGCDDIEAAAMEKYANVPTPRNINIANCQVNEWVASADVTAFYLVNSDCGEGKEPDYPNTECKTDPEPDPDPDPEPPEPDPDKNYCDTVQASLDLEAARNACINGNPDPAEYDAHFSGRCNREAQAIESSCEYTPHNPNPEPEPDPDPNPEPPTPDPDGGGDNGGGGGGGGDNGGIDPKPKPDPDGGGDGGDSEDDFCKNNPEYCKPVDKPECRDAPWLCDVPPEPTNDLIASINRVTASIQNHNKTSVDIKTNTKHVAGNTNKALDKAEAIKRSVNAIDMTTKKMAEHDDKNDKALLRKIDLSNAKLGDIKDAITKQKPGNISGALTTMNQTLKEIKSELKKGFCDKNKDHLSCQKVTERDPYKKILGNEAIADLKAQTKDVQEQLKAKMDSFKSVLGSPSFSAGGAIKPVEFSLNTLGGSVNVSFDAFNEVGASVKSLVIAICALIAFFVICRR